MKQEHFLRALALVALVLGATSLFGAFMVEEISALRQASSAAVGLLLVFAAALLAAKRKLAAVFLWLSALAYAASMLYPAFQRHGSQTFSVLMDAFFWSAGIRIALAALAQAAFSPVSARLWKSQ